MAPYHCLPIIPSRLNPYGAVERDGKDPRLCADLSAPQGSRDGKGALSVNAGIPFHDKAIIADMRLTSSKVFARDVGILQAASVVDQARFCEHEHVG